MGLGLGISPKNFTSSSIVNFELDSNFAIISENNFIAYSLVSWGIPASEFAHKAKRAAVSKIKYFIFLANIKFIEFIKNCTEV